MEAELKKYEDERQITKGGREKKGKSRKSENIRKQVMQRKNQRSRDGQKRRKQFSNKMGVIERGWGIVQLAKMDV